MQRKAITKPSRPSKSNELIIKPDSPDKLPAQLPPQTTRYVHISFYIYMAKTKHRKINLPFTTLTVTPSNPEVSNLDTPKQTKEQTHPRLGWAPGIPAP